MKTTILLSTLLFLFAGIAIGQPASWQPAAPRVGDAVTIRYDSRVGLLGPSVTTMWLHWGVVDPVSGSWSTPPQAIWPAGSRLHSDQVAVQSPMMRGADTVWSVTIDFDTSVHDVAFVFTDGITNWDNNNNNNWIINFVLPGVVSWWTPADPEPGDIVTILYDCVPGTLPNTATSVILHWGVNESGHGNWQAPPPGIWPEGTVLQGTAARTPMTSLGGGLFQTIIHTTDSILSIHYVTTDGTNWDNNGNANWDIFLVPPPPVVLTHRIFRYDQRSAFANMVPGAINSVNLAGAFNGWSTTANPLTGIDQFGNRWADIALPVASNEYKFVINGNNWQIDPDNPRNAPGGNNNSLLILTADSLPQIYDIQPFENLVSAIGANVIVSVKIRAGDLGPGISGTPVARVNGNVWTANWNATNSQLTLAALPNNVPYVDVAISATDSAGRVGTRHLAFAFKSAGWAAADPYEDIAYRTNVPDPQHDLIRMSIEELNNGDSLLMAVRFVDADLNTTMSMITISSALDGWGPIPGFGGEVNVPNMAVGGVALLLLDPSSTHYNAAIHNRLHPNGDLTISGSPIALTYDVATHSYLARIATADLESYLGSYQSAWYFTCASYFAADAQDGYCLEIPAAMGGVAGLEDPDAIDVINYYAADVEQKVFRNYGLTRRMTLDAAGRGVAQILPADIGPHMAAAGPLCRIMTQGAPTIDTVQSVHARVTSPVALAQTWLTQNDNRLNVTMVADTFVSSVTLVEGTNRFMVYSVDVNGDTGRSPAMIFTLVIDHSPDIRMTTRVEGNQGVLDASTSVDPEQQAITYTWTPAPNNPAPVTLLNPGSSVARFDVPTTLGEYYFNLVATDPDNHARNAKTFFTITVDSAHGFVNNECADWVSNAIIYEIFPRSYSATGNLAGITADLPRISNLGVNCIWLMPIFEGPSDHGYEITDYYRIEQDYGTDQDLHDLVNAAHALGIKIVLDMVINHTGIGHPFMQDCLRHGRYSHYWNYYDRDANGNYTYYFDWLSLPNINMNNPETVKYYIDMCKYWIQQFDIDGYRCDVAWGPMQRSPQFWVKWRQELKEIKPDVLLLAEADASQFQIFTNRFDLALDWNLHHQGGSSFANMFPAVPGFTNLTELINNYNVGWPAYKYPLRFMENHDETRYISLNTASQTKLVSSLMLSMPGAVMLYAGQENGTTSQRGAIAWNSDPNALYPHYYRLTRARQQLPALRTGAFLRLDNSQNTSCYSYARYGTGMDPAVFVGNFSANSPVVSVSLNPVTLGLHLDSTYVVTEMISGTSFTSTGANLTSMITSLSAYQSRLWVISNHIITIDAPPARPELPRANKLHAAYPNPFNPTTVLPLELSNSMHVTVKIFNVLGREVATVVDEVMDAGMHELIWDGKSSGREVSSGLYFAVMTTNNSKQIQKLILMR